MKYGCTTLKKIFSLAVSLILAISFAACISFVPDKPSDSADNSQLSGSQISSPADSSYTDCGAHADADDNGVCDNCNISVLVEVEFYSINDLHGKIYDTESQPGLDELSSYLKTQRQTKENVFFISAGDMWQGSAESNYTRGSFMTEWMNQMEFTAMTLGNHEFDWGEQAIKNNYELAQFPILAINIYDKSTNERVPYCTPSILLEANGVKIGLIGAIGNCYSSISNEQVANLYFKTGSDLANLVKSEANSLRNQGADFIVYSLHGDTDSSYQISLSSGFVDLVFEGHSHQRYITKDTKNVYHIQAGAENDAIGHAKIQINTANEHKAVTEANIINNSEYSKYPSDPIIENINAEYSDKLDWMFEKVANNSAYRSSSYICELVAKLYYQAGASKWSKDYNIVLGGGYLKTRSPYSLKKGQVTYANLYELLPFDNDIVLCSVSGSILKSNFINSSNSSYHIYMPDENITSSIIDTNTYYIITDTYTSQYSPNRLTVIDTYKPNTYARDVLFDYVKAGGLN